MLISLKRSCLLIILSLLFVPVWASAFIAKHIEVEGIQRIAKATVLNYLPVRVGDEINKDNSTLIIQALYKTGFFSDVRLKQRHDTLLILVKEQSTIAQVQISGNKLLATNKLKDALKDLGVVVGRVYNQALLDNIKQSLEHEYFSQGMYNAQVNMLVTAKERNRVAIHVQIYEGSSAKIKEIKIVGNKRFSQRTLLREFSSTPTRLWSYITQGDRYSRERLDADLEKLRSFYLDKGYIKFDILSPEISLSSDRKQVHIIIHVQEGEQFHLSDYHLSGQLIVAKEKLRSLIHLTSGMIFSRKQMFEARKTLAEYYGNLGYAFANVNIRPQVDVKKQQVSITFYINPGRRVYVRHINFSGNNKTADVVLRRAMRQIEGGLINLDNVKESEHQLNLLGYLKNVRQETIAVPGTNNQVDINFHVDESASASANVGAGYSSDGLFVNAGINQQNFMGSGKSFSINFNNDKLMRSYAMSYNNPYYTTNGIQRGFNVFSTRTTPGDVNITNYVTDTLGAAVSYSIPLKGDRDSINVGYSYRNTRMKIGSAPSEELIKFVCDGSLCDRKRRVYDQFVLNASWGRTTYDRAVFTTSGLSQSLAMSLSLPVPELHHDLEYYLLSYHVKDYYPITKDFIVMTKGLIEFGDGYHNQHHLPLIENFYSGGIGSVRGYESNILGPKDGKGDPLGGNLNVLASIALIFPNHLSDMLRTSLFVDGGNVFDTRTKISLKQLRFSVGISAEWHMALGVLEFSLAKAFHHSRTDKLEAFGFNIGTGM